MAYGFLVSSVSVAQCDQRLLVRLRLWPGFGPLPGAAENAVPVRDAPTERRTTRPEPGDATQEQGDAFNNAVRNMWDDAGGLIEAHEVWTAQFRKAAVEQLPSRPGKRRKPWLTTAK